MAPQGGGGAHRERGGGGGAIAPRGRGGAHKRRVSSVVKHSSTNPKVPGSIPGPVSYQGHRL